MSPLYLLLMLPVCAVVSIVYSATRTDDFRAIARDSVRRFLTFAFWVVVLGVGLVVFSTFF